jgi:hypothetical protein
MKPIERAGGGHWPPGRLSFQGWETPRFCSLLRRRRSLLCAKILPVTGKKAPCYFSFVAALKSPTRRLSPSASRAARPPERVFAGKTARQILHAFSGLSFFSLLDGSVVLF